MASGFSRTVPARRPLAIRFRTRSRRLQLAVHACLTILAFTARLSVSNLPVGALLIPFGLNRDRSPRLPPTCARASTFAKATADKPADGERPSRPQSQLVRANDKIRRDLL